MSLDALLDAHHRNSDAVSEQRQAGTAVESSRTSRKVDGGDEEDGTTPRLKAHGGRSSALALESALQRGGFAASYFMQFVVLFQRFALDYLRDPKKFLTGLFVRTAIGVILGAVWFDQAGTTQGSIFPIQVDNQAGDRVGQFGSMQ